jgi:hypothetical protein
MPNLPTIGGSENTWGDELNDFLTTGLQSTGALPFYWAIVTWSGSAYSYTYTNNSTLFDTITNAAPGSITLRSTDAHNNYAQDTVVLCTTINNTEMLYVDGYEKNGHYLYIHIQDKDGVSKDNSFMVMVNAKDLA